MPDVAAATLTQTANAQQFQAKQDFAEQMATTSGMTYHIIPNTLVNTDRYNAIWGATPTPSPTLSSNDPTNEDHITPQTHHASIAEAQVNCHEKRSIGRSYGVHRSVHTLRNTI